MKDIIEKLNLILKQTDSSDLLWAAVIGALAAIIPQILFWFLNIKKEKKQTLLEIKAELHRLEYLLKDHYRELVMHKTHKFYWLAQHQNSEEEGNQDKATEFYNAHRKSADQTRETELKIANTFSEFYKLLIKFQHITKFNDNISTLIDEYHEYQPKKPKRIDSSKDNLPKEEAKEEKRLRKEYDEYSKIIRKIVKVVNAN